MAENRKNAKEAPKKLSTAELRRQLAAAMNTGPALTPASNRAHGIDPADFTADVPSQRAWTIHNMPDVIYQLKPNRSYVEGTNRRRPGKLPYLIFGRRLRDFTGILPDRISSNVEGWLLESWFRHDLNIEWADITDRIHPIFRPWSNTLQMERTRFRETCHLLAWITRARGSRHAGKAAALEEHLKKVGIDPDANTTRGLTPGLVDPNNPNGPRIPMPERWLRQRMQRASDIQRLCRVVDKKNRRATLIEHGRGKRRREHEKDSEHNESHLLTSTGIPESEYTLASVDYRPFSQSNLRGNEAYSFDHDPRETCYSTNTADNIEDTQVSELVPPSYEEWEEQHGPLQYEEYVEERTELGLSFMRQATWLRREGHQAYAEYIRRRRQEHEGTVEAARDTQTSSLFENAPGYGTQELDPGLSMPEAVVEQSQGNSSYDPMPILYRDFDEWHEAYGEIAFRQYVDNGGVLTQLNWYLKVAPQTHKEYAYRLIGIPLP